MVACINGVLELIINIAIVSGIFILIFFYCKLNTVEKKIGKIWIDSKKERELIERRGETIGYVQGELKNEEQKTQEQIAPLERERKRILSKIPFLK